MTGKFLKFVTYLHSTNVLRPANLDTIGVPRVVLIRMMLSGLLSKLPDLCLEHIESDVHGQSLDAILLG